MYRWLGACLRSAGIVLACLPLCHSYGVEHGLLAPLWAGAAVHLQSGFDLHAVCREILPRFGVRVECRLAAFDPVTGELDLGHLTSLVDGRTKLVACTGASNFLGMIHLACAVILLRAFMR